MGFELLKELGQLGLLGIIAALLGLVVKRLDAERTALWQQHLQATNNLQEKRIEDASKITQVIEATNSTYAALAITTENRSKLWETVADAVKVSAQTLERQMALLEHMRREIDEGARNIKSIIETAEQGRSTLDRLSTQNEQIMRRLEELERRNR